MQGVEVRGGVLQGEHLHLLPQRHSQRLHSPRPHSRQTKGTFSWLIRERLAGEKGFFPTYDEFCKVYIEKYDHPGDTVYPPTLFGPKKYEKEINEGNCE
jgi:hypothetical protein